MIRFHPEYVGMRPSTAAPLAARDGLTLEFAGEYSFTPERLYIRCEDGVISEAFEVIDPLVRKSH